ncbi:prephenate dehydratase [Pontibacter sp. 13R65]|uniref:prephenate dehydratase n=1 Tax=Pontibacter sp. 13R65 TaxID=3127458 RepID=UPI00301D7D27
MATKIKIAIQGGAASFHDTAARQYFAPEKAEILPCSSFDQLCEQLHLGEATYGVMAIQNALAGSILTNYTLLQEYHHFHIIGELWLPIDQNLMALPGQRLEDITTVISHPVALLQCGLFLRQHKHLHTEERQDTADSAREISANGLKGVAAIASSQAAELYGMEMLQEHVADRKDNYTRFLVLANHPQEQTQRPTANKASLVVQIPHVGSLLGAVINKLYTEDINIPLIQSIPAPSGNTSHNVAIDLECDDYYRLLHAIEELKPMVENLQLLGLYHKALTPQQLEECRECALTTSVN